MGNWRDANYLMDEVKKQVESTELDLSKSDLMQFITYLLCVFFFKKNKRFAIEEGRRGERNRGELNLRF